MASKKYLLAGASFALLALACPVLAQEPAAPTVAAGEEPTSGTTVYDEVFFQRYQTNTAEDMLRRIPGVGAILDESLANTQTVRGFGSGGAQILLNGRRFPGKSNEITTTLRRLPATNVLRVELIRGASSEIDIQSQGIVVNIVLKPDASLSITTHSYELNARFNDEGYFDVDGLISRSGSIGALSYVVGLERNLWTRPEGGGTRWTDKTRREIYYYPNRTIQEFRPQVYARDLDKWSFTASGGYEFASGDRLNVNALYSVSNILETDNTNFTRYSLAGAVTTQGREYHQRDFDGTTISEIGGEYLSGIGAGDLRILFIGSRRDTPTNDFRNRYTPAGALTEVSRNFVQVKLGEDILRGSYSLPIFAGQTLEFGGEGARNTLDQDLQAFFDTNADGLLEPVVIPTAQAEVEEARAEAFVNHKWTINSALSLDSTVTYEFSELTTNYPFQPDRTLRFLKPRFDARYKVTPSDEIRLLAERTISQLDFANFVPRYNLADDRIEAGNPGLEPEKTWIYEVGYEHRLARDGGSWGGRAFYHDITDVIDRTPLIQNGFLVSASGNLPEGRRYGVEGKASVRLGFLGLNDAVFSVRYLRQWSETTDPFSGDRRRLGNDRKYNADASFRHDLPALKMAYGASYRVIGKVSSLSELLFQEQFFLTPILEIFAERRLFGSTTVRFEAQNVTGSPEYKLRTLYTSDVRNGQIRRYESFLERRDFRMAVRLLGRF